MWFLACPPVKERNPSWAPNEIYVFQHDPARMAALAPHLPEVALLVTENNVRGQLMRGTLAEHLTVPPEGNAGGRVLIPVTVGEAFNTHLRTPAQQADEVLSMAQSSPGLNIVLALPGPLLKGIYNALGLAVRQPVEPYSLRQGTYNPQRRRIGFKRPVKPASLQLTTVMGSK